jgi:hypothetical protein
MSQAEGRSVVVRAVKVSGVAPLVFWRHSSS